jgi:hypothetical protein
MLPVAVAATRGRQGAGEGERHRSDDMTDFCPDVPGNGYCLGWQCSTSASIGIYIENS